MFMMVLDSVVILIIILLNSNSNLWLTMEYKNISIVGNTDSVRYLLKKEGKQILYVIGINPSTANEEKPDRTIGRVMGFAEENGFDGFAMINLYPQRSTRPYNLHQELCVKMHKNNLSAIKELFCDVHSPTILLAFGNNIGIRRYLKDCFRDIVSILQSHSPQWQQIGNLTRLGNPRHPLYARNDPFRDFDVQQYLKKK